jgi:Raf kinase inhibitor-like YbhB/YbcL family protein
VRRVGLGLAVVLLLVAACGGDDGDDDAATESSSGPAEQGAAAFALTSPAFGDGAAIPEQFTCDGAGVSPPLEWAGFPEGTRELALTVDDPDAPSGNFVHWVAWGIDPDAGSLAEGAVPEGMVQGVNGAGEAGYSGPCPPAGPAHRYVFTLYAVSQPLTLAAGADEAALLAAIAEVELAETQLTGTYGRS